MKCISISSSSSRNCGRWRVARRWLSVSAGVGFCVLLGTSCFAMLCYRYYVARTDATIAGDQSRIYFSKAGSRRNFTRQYLYTNNNFLMWCGRGGDPCV